MSRAPAAERKPIPFLRTEFNENASKLLRQREDVHGVAAAGRVRFGSQAHTEGSDRAATSRDGDVLASVDRIRDGPADDLRGKPRLPHDLASVGIQRPQITIHRTVEQES